MAAAFSLTACIKIELPEFTDGIAEIDATSWNANAAGLTYPIITRKPAFGRAVNTSDSTLRRYAQTIQIRVNLVGEQSNADRTLTYETFTSPITTVSMPATISGQTPSAPAATLAVSDAVAGTHYQALSGTVTIPANSSFGIITVNILNPGPTAGSARFLGIRITDGGSLKASTNYSQLGLIIDQR
jgi:hypothetical protein